MAVHVGGGNCFNFTRKKSLRRIKSYSYYSIWNVSKKILSWFLKHDWGFKTDYYQANFLPAKMGLRCFNQEGTTTISNSVRAMMELYI